MHAFWVGWIEVVCAVVAAAVVAIAPSPRVPAGRSRPRKKVSVILRVVCYVISTSRKGVLILHMACRVAASFRANTTLALRGPVFRQSP
jgi:hypothetical protein